MENKSKLLKTPLVVPPPINRLGLRRWRFHRRNDTNGETIHGLKFWLEVRGGPMAYCSSGRENWRRFILIDYCSMEWVCSVENGYAVVKWGDLLGAVLVNGDSTKKTVNIVLPPVDKIGPNSSILCCHMSWQSGVGLPRVFSRPSLYILYWWKNVRT